MASPSRECRTRHGGSQDEPVGPDRGSELLCWQDPLFPLEKNRGEKGGAPPPFLSPRGKNAKMVQPMEPDAAGER
jgi:hypothetical protein